MLLDLIDELIAELDVTYTDTTITTKNVKIQNPIVGKIIIHEKYTLYFSNMNASIILFVYASLHFF